MPRQKTSEGSVQEPVIAWAKARYIKVTRRVFRPGIEVGWPDCEFLIPGGAPAFVEFKAPGKKPTALQWERMKYLEDNGYHVAWFDNADEAIAWLAPLVEEGRERLQEGC